MAITLPTIGQAAWGGPLNLALTTLDTNATAAQATADSAAATAATASTNATAAVGTANTANTNATNALNAVTGKIDASITRTVAGSTIQTINLNYTTDINDPNLEEVKQNGTLISWRNENGHWRARCSTNAKSDSTFRAIQVSAQTGHPFEYENEARTTRLWAINPTDGATMRSDVKMADVLVLGSGDPIPAATPAGTVIMRTA